MRMIKQSPRVVALNEPHIGVHLAPFAPNLLGLRATHLPSQQWLFNTMMADLPVYFFSKEFEHRWRPNTRRLILDRLHSEVRARAHRDRIRRPITIVKEPNGSQAAEMIMSLLPRAKMIFLLRDGRDVVDSEVDLTERGTWLEQFGYESKQLSDRLAFVEHQSHTWRFRTEIVQAAYDRLPAEQRLLVRYEELLENTSEELQRVYEWLGLAASSDEIQAIAGAFAFDAAPAEARGSGKFMRAAKRGLWRENRTAEEQAVMEAVMGDTLRQLDYE